MAYYKGFDKEKFYDWIETNTDITIYDILDKIIEYAHKHEHISKNQFVMFITSMMPNEIIFEDVALFAEDEILSDGMLKYLGRM